MKFREKIEGDTDWFKCRCGNEPHSDGFFPCDYDGRIIPPLIDGKWEGHLYVCIRCGRIIEQYTLDVVGVTNEDAAFHNANFDWENY